MGARARFPKPLEVYESLAAFGPNILVTEGAEWKRQRKIAAPAFSEVRLLAPARSGIEHNIHWRSSQRNNKLIWDETFRIVDEMFQTVWGDQDVVEVDHVMELTVPVSPSRAMTRSARIANPPDYRSHSW